MKKNKSQTARNKFLGYSSIGLGILVIIAIIISSVFVSLTSQAYRNRTTALSAGYEFQMASDDLTTWARLYANSGNKEYYDAYWDEVNTVKRRDIAVQEIEDSLHDEEAQAIINEMMNLSNSLIPMEEESMALAAAGRYDEAVDLMLGTTYDEIKTQINVHGEELMAELDVYSEALVSRYMMFLIGSIVLIVIFALILIAMQISYMRFVATGILVPVVKIRDNVVSMSQGDLKAPLDIQRDESEIGVLTGALIDAKSTLGDYVNIITGTLDDLADGNFDLYMDHQFLGDFAPITKALNLIIDKLNEAMRNIKEAAHQVNSGSEQVSSGAQTLSQGATEQASAVEQLSASISQISEQVKTNAENSRYADEISDKAAKSMIHANTQMKDMLAAMNEINNKASEINKIIKTIDDIAFQTNILALNASVEAARAGAAGKGFAVVADEVRNLAGKSAEAANQTTALIEAAIEAVANGNKIADATAETMLSVVDDVKETARLLEEITSASDEQSTAVEQINVGVEQISSVVETNTATAEESAAASEELFSQSQVLDNEVAKYKLRGQSAVKSTPVADQDNSYSLDISDKY